jgi:L,D-transpeptidase YcbB
MMSKLSNGAGLFSVIAAIGLLAAPASAAPSAPAPRAASPEATPVAASAPKPVAPSSVVPAPVPLATPSAAEAETPPVVVSEPLLPWGVRDAQALLRVIEGIGADGLFPADYQPEVLRAALALGPGPELDLAASLSFSWLVEDMRDGRTPMPARVQWFAVDPDQDVTPTRKLMEQALATHDIAGVIAGLAPTHPDYAALKQAYALLPPERASERALIRANMDRWRWLQRDLGSLYLLTNVPEFQLRLAKNYEIIKTYKTVVGKPGRTATPQLAETVEAVVFNPTWTVPQSIVKGEGLGAQLLANPARAARENYKVTKAANGFITVVQQPGPNNALGMMKIDFPNPHAIFMHDTPSKQYFDHEVRAYSHGCVRTERAVELGMTLAIFGAGLSTDEVVANATSGKYTRVTMTRQLPVYITYFTYGTDIQGNLTRFKDIYGRDKPVLASFEEPRQLKTTQRKSNEKVIKLDNPL